MKSFNLIEEDWIPIVGVGRVSLQRIFTDETLYRLGGNAIEKIVVLKLLQAIAQVAATPKNTSEWCEVGRNLSIFGKKCVDYLETQKANFELYGERPFLQMPQVKGAASYELSSRMPFVASGNNTVTRQSQFPRTVDDATAAMLLLTLMSCDFAGKRHDEKIVLAKSYTKKKAAHAGPSIADFGALHSFCFGKSILETIWLNTFTEEEISNLSQCPKGLGIPPWEKMPKTENDSISSDLKETLMGRLIPMSRFCYLSGTEVHVTEGIVHPGVKENGFDPSHLVKEVEDSKNKGATVKALTWTDPEKRPWRELTALLSFLNANTKSSTNCQQVKFCLRKANQANIGPINLWSGGLQIKKYTTGDQKVIGSNDYVESETSISPTEGWYVKYCFEMNLLQASAKHLDRCIKDYFKEISTSKDSNPTGNAIKDQQLAKNIAAAAMRDFWRGCEIYQQRIVDNCECPEKMDPIRKEIGKLINQVFNQTCPRDTSRQIKAWASSRPCLANYLKP